MPSGTKLAGTELGAFQSASPPTTKAGLSMSSTAAASPRGSRHDSEVGVAPHFHTAKLVSKKVLLLGRPMATKSLGLTPLAAKARARRLAPPPGPSPDQTTAPPPIPNPSLRLPSAYQRRTSALASGINRLRSLAP